MDWVRWCQAHPEGLKGLQALFSSKAALHPEWWASEKFLKKKIAAELPSNFVCYECGEAFGTKAALHTHLFKKHKVKKPTRRYVDDSICPVCLTQFHTRHRVVHHLERHSRCRDALCNSPPLLSPEAAEALDEKERELHRALHKRGQPPTHAALPAYRMCGPRVLSFYRAIPG